MWFIQFIFTLNVDLFYALKINVEVYSSNICLFLLLFANSKYFSSKYIFKIFIGRNKLLLNSWYDKSEWADAFCC